MKHWRFTHAEYSAWREKFLEGNPGYDEWLYASTNEIPIKEIMMRALLCHESSEKQFISFTLMLNNNRFTEEQFDDLLFINSGMFSFATWDDECVAFVLDLLADGTEVNIKPTLEEVAKGFAGAYADLPVSLHKQAKNILDKIHRKMISSLNLSIIKATDIMRCSLFRNSKIDEYTLKIGELRKSRALSTSKYEKAMMTGKILEMEKEIDSLISAEACAKDAAVKHTEAFYKSLEDRDRFNTFMLIDRFTWADVCATQNFSDEYFDRYDSLFTERDRHKRAEIKKKNILR